MIFSGSSVTAGHDSYFNQSYPLIVQKHMGPILRTLGVQLVVHNIAQGANNCIPYTLCYESMGGFDPDFVNWEQSYNCGHEEPVFEAVARLASMSARKAIAYYSASGAWSPSQCPPANESLPYCEESWTPSAAGLEEWEADQAQLEDFKQALFRFNSKGASYSR
ncbi:hypothetical protein B484DRAFT_201057 [Ochromonadaceae sp. CCMP2298]|nr:hypothetical protein B484DRAFT_201057 [Ochromonadaceae sp. CCMP2298]